MDTLRFGMIGAGAISNAHVPSIKGIDGAEIVCSTRRRPAQNSGAPSARW